ncbi:MAG: BatD family protein [Desulfobacterales bacterium]|nr:BatD family protein [Desulfobacterales bacterium]
MTGFYLRKHLRDRLWSLGIILALLLLLPAAGYGFSATAQVDNTRISAQDMVTLQVVVEGGQAQVDLSRLTDFEVLSTGTRTSRSYVNGDWDHEVVYTHRLMPKKTGVLIIPPLVVSRDGESAVTREIRILVSEVPLADRDTGDFFARAQINEAEETDIVLGQQAVYTLRLFAAGNFAGASFDPPSFTGLAARELTKWKKYTRNIEGRVYVVNEISFLIQGEAPGKFEISPAVFMARKPVGGKRRDPFDSFFDDSFFQTTRTRPVRVVSNPVSVSVRPLPVYDGAGVFSGLVGKFTVSSALDREQIKVGESVTLTVTVRGTGNIMDAGLPKLDIDAERFKVYEDSPVENIRAGDTGITGEKVFKQALVPGIPGKVSIPAAQLTYFDTETYAYNTVSTAPLMLDVMPGEPVTVVSSESPSQPAGNAKQDVVMRNRDILDIREDISSIRSDTHLSLHWFLAFLLLPGAGFAVAGVLTGMRRREKTPSEKLQSKARAHLDSAGKLDPEDPELPGKLQAALTAAVLATGKKPAESLTRDEARKMLQKNGTDAELIEKVLGLMDAMDAARFGGAAVTADIARGWTDQVRQVVKVLCLVLCFGVLAIRGEYSTPVYAAASDAAGAQTTDMAGLFVDSTRAYKSGDYSLAAQGFETIAKTGVKNPDLFYNAGNAWLKTGDIGRAVLWYERASRLNPGDPDLRFNLAHARTLARDKVETTLRVADILFFWQGMVSLKQIQIMAIGGSVVFFTWAGFRRMRQRRIFNGAGVAALLVACALVLVTGLEAYRLNAASAAVILADEVAVRSGTLDTATPLFDLHAGTRVAVLEVKGDFLKIRFAKDKVGWVSRSEAEII